MQVGQLPLVEVRQAAQDWQTKLHGTSKQDSSPLPGNNPYADTLRRIRINPPTAPPTVDSTSRIPDSIPNPTSIMPARNSGEYQNLCISGGCGVIVAAFSN